MFLVFGKAFLEESHRRYYVKIEPKPGSERILEPAWRTLLRIHFLIFYLSGNFWPPSSIFFWSSIFPVRGVICSQDKMENVSFRAIWWQEQQQQQQERQQQQQQPPAAAAAAAAPAAASSSRGMAFSFFLALVLPLRPFSLSFHAILSM